MSIPFNIEIPIEPNKTLFINITGVSSDRISRDRLKAYFYAMDNSTAELLFSFTLNFDSIQKLYYHIDALSIIKSGANSISRKFIEIGDNQAELLKAIELVNTDVLKMLISKIEDSNKISIILGSLNEIDVQNIHTTIRQTQHKKAIKHLKEMLRYETDDTLKQIVNREEDYVPYRAGQQEKIFQNWIEKNIWSLGIDYIKKHDVRMIGINTEADLLMESVDGYVDLIELKRPRFELFSYDSSHKSYYPSVELSKVIGQSLKYLKSLDTYRLALEAEYKFKVLRPRIKIIIGRSNGFNNEENDALRMLNSGLSHIQVITYDNLLLGAENILSYYDLQVKSADLEILPSIS